MSDCQHVWDTGYDGGHYGHSWGPRCVLCGESKPVGYVASGHAVAAQVIDLAQLKADAERYRWLRDVAKVHKSWPAQPDSVPPITISVRLDVWAATLDEAIDAAMARRNAAEESSK